MSRFVAVDLSQLPPPQLIDALDYERVLGEIKALFLARWEIKRAANPALPEIDFLVLEPEPLTTAFEAFCYRELTLRALINDKARAVLLAFAVGADLDHIGALFGVARAVVDPGPPPVMETDERFRRRVQLAPEAFSVAGPQGAYVFHALTTAPQIADAHALSPAEGRVTVVLAGPDGADVAQDDLVAVIEKLAREDTVPLTDIVTVRRADRVPYDVTATLVFARGPDPSLILAEAEAAIRAHAAGRTRIASEVFRAGLFAAAKVGGVDNIILAVPAADVVCDDVQIPVLGAVTLTAEVV